MSTVIGTNQLVRHAMRRDRVLASIWVMVLVDVVLYWRFRRAGWL